MSHCIRGVGKGGRRHRISLVDIPCIRRYNSLGSPACWALAAKAKVQTHLDNNSFVIDPESLLDHFTRLCCSIAAGECSIFVSVHLITAEFTTDHLVLRERSG